ncbi:LysR substrate-binding domain-containing protein [Gemmobacter sp. 24YEA27]|uniref:LysR substrate-binding domain-containing protein n=1 Tax=Gemmobacter sp. 24YEA27 TaxID=3040672 RepID=UPI0024B381D1|nr:LysR substrate-binding domain-containing protein [Gemmobacter sp. 24YEA27]
MLYEQVSHAMAEVQAGLARLSEVAAQRRGHVRIACAPTLASTRLGRILATFKLRYPRSLVDLKETPPNAALALLQEQEVELYIGPEVPAQRFPVRADPRRPSRRLYPADFDEGAQRFMLSEVARFPLILLDRQTAIRAQIDRWRQIRTSR